MGTILWSESSGKTMFSIKISFATALFIPIQISNDRLKSWLLPFLFRLDIPVENIFWTNSIFSLADCRVAANVAKVDVLQAGRRSALENIKVGHPVVKLVLEIDFWPVKVFKYLFPQNRLECVHRSRHSRGRQCKDESQDWFHPR